MNDRIIPKYSLAGPLIETELAHLNRVILSKLISPAMRGNPVLPRAYWKARLEAVAVLTDLTDNHRHTIARLRHLLGELDARFPE